MDIGICLVIVSCNLYLYKHKYLRYLLGKIWQIQPKKYDDVILQLLYNRGVISQLEDKKKIDRFFKPDFAKDLHNSDLLPDIKKAIKRIALAVEKKEVVGIYADYDADGIPGAALMYKTFVALGNRVEVFIPNREQGYGLGKEGIDSLKKKRCSLIITVDLGIRNHKEADYCKSKNIDLIITDHHLPDETLPSAVAVINPMRHDSKYPFQGLSGAGVAYKIVQALSKKYPKQINQSFLKWNLDLVAISTIADVVPLQDENRTIAKYGLIVLNKTKNIGLAELVKFAGTKEGYLPAYAVAFQIAPRINAPGRIDHATKSFRLLTTDDQKEAKELASWLNDKNIERQEAMEQLYLEAVEKVEKHKLAENNIIVVAGEWAKGILGPSASQIVEKYYRPAIVFSSNINTFTGSARSIEGVNIVSIFEQMKKYLIRFGGHKGAAGLSLGKDKFKTFSEQIIKYCNKNIDKKLLTPKIKVDAEINPKDLGLNLYDEILQFEPFGMGNPKPVFVLRDVIMENPRFVGREEKHLSSQIVSGEKRFKAIYFSYAKDRDIIKHGNICDVAFSLSEDNWDNKRKLSLNIIDLKVR